MDLIKRYLEEIVRKKFFLGKAIIIIGPRQSGKTTLVKELIRNSEEPSVWFNGDEPGVRTLFKDISSSNLRSLIGSNKLVVIDEAQRIENIGLCIKLIVDNLPGLQVIATGSSSFELANRINEPLTGRKFEYFLYPLSFSEMTAEHGLFEERQNLEQRLIYGYYPEIITGAETKTITLKMLADSYLYKDILTWEHIKKSDRLERLVQALAFQVGNQVSYHELGQMAGLDNETTEKYINLLEKAFIIFRLSSFSRNLRNELKKSRKIYFYDNGIRNAVLNNFNSLSLRSDVGALWENYFISERMKYIHYNQIYANTFFWRTYNQQEIDYIEEREGRMFAFEIKWNVKAKVRFPQSFLKAYQETETSLITPGNFESFLGIK